MILNKFLMVIFTAGLLWFYMYMFIYDIEGKSKKFHIASCSIILIASLILAFKV